MNLRKVAEAREKSSLTAGERPPFRINGSCRAVLRQEAGAWSG
jgi:hypothetical protein